jgi:hypothetical protein
MVGRGLEAASGISPCPNHHAFTRAQAGPSGDALEIAVPAALTRLFRHPTLDWGLFSKSQKELKQREVRVAACGSTAQAGATYTAAAH